MSDAPLDVDQARNRARSFSMGALASLVGLGVRLFSPAPATTFRPTEEDAWIRSGLAFLTECASLLVIGVWCLVMALRYARSLPPESAASPSKQDAARKTEFPDDPY